ncbi:MAG: cation-translocating P-type ATPase, partial [Acidimicrobiales bacterium]
SEGITAVGDPTEAALVALAGKVGVEGQSDRQRFERLAEIPFTAERRRMSTVQLDRSDGRVILITKGAPDSLLERCRWERAGGEERVLSDARRARWSEAVDGMADNALRTLAVAYRTLAVDGGVQTDDLDLDLDGESVEDQLVLLAVVGIMDPPRPEAGQAIEVARRAGIRVAMITGDHPRTAARIASELGIADNDGHVVSAVELSACDDDELAELVRNSSVYARVAPEHKLRIVKALTGQGEIVAMTGDGVNDAPALKAANIGVAMGITGTDVSKEAADMILTDDNFATIVAAVDEGRAIFHNIRSFLRYLLSSNVGEVLAVFLGVIGASVIGLTDGDGPAAPLLAVQILWINLITDTGPALALGIDPPPPGLMQRRPRRLSARIVDRRMQAGIGLIGLTMAIATLIMLDARLPGGLIEGDQDLASARTAAFTVLVLAQLFNAFAARSDTESAFVRMFSNRWLVAAVGLSFALQVAVVHLPVLNRAFGTVPLEVSDWVWAVALASSVIWVAEIRKIVLRRRTPVAELD